MDSQYILFPSLDTPCLLLNLDLLEGNIREMSELASRAGLKLRPHIKIHESALLAKLQTEAGAIGIEVGTLEQAEAMVEEGFNDIIVAHPVYGDHKLAVLKRLLHKPALKLTLVVDMVEQAQCFSPIAQEIGREIPALVKINIGGNRFGVLPGQPALELAKQLCRLPGIRVLGIYAHETGAEPTQGGVDRKACEAASMMAETARMLRKEGIDVAHVSVGSSPTFRSTCRLLMEGKFREITEIHPGSCVVGDMNYTRSFGLPESRCALTILTTVTSAHTDRAVLDCGAKTFGADRTGSREAPGYGIVREHPDLFLGRMSNETSIISYRGSERRLHLGERLEIVPNNAMVVINIHNQMYGVRNGMVEKVIPITGQGRGN
jgi:D-serine deaminase-like pyridoxal phosphate-dependent protein